MRARKNSDDYIFIDADVYQTAFLNKMLPHGIRLETEDFVYRQVKRQKENEKRMASKKIQDERLEK